MTDLTPRQEAAAVARLEAEQEAVLLCSRLSPFEKECLTFAAKGLTYSKIAIAMHRHTDTIQGYLSSGKQVLEVDSVIEAAVLLTKAGLV